MVDLYTNAEYTEMLLIYGETRKNSREACRRYQQRYPNRRHPSHTMFARLKRSLRETGSLRPDKHSCGRPQTRRTPDFEDHPSTSTRTVAHTIGINYMSVWQVLHDFQRHPYHLLKAQAMTQDDYAPRAFCRWLLRQTKQAPHFLRVILLSDECTTFTRDGMFNSRNSHV